MLSRSGRLFVPDLWRFLPKLGGATAPPFLFLGGTVNSYRAHRPGLDACYAGRLQMDEPSVLGRVKVREVTGIFASSIAASPAVDSLLIAGFDRADIDVVAGSGKLRDRIGIDAAPAVELAHIPGAPRQEFVTPEDTASVFSLCVAIVGCLGALIGAITVISAGGTTLGTVIGAIVGAAAGCGVGILIARRLGWRWSAAPVELAGTDGIVLCVRVRTEEQEQTAQQILAARGGELVAVHEIEIDKRLEDLPLSSLRPDPWLGDEHLARP